MVCQAHRDEWADRYTPPTPTFSSSHGPTGTAVTVTDIKFTATFDYAVANVAKGDFNVQSSASGVTWTETVSTTDNKVWELIVSVTGGFVDTAFSVSMARDSGSITRPNAAATNNGFSISCA